jgi:NAD(P)-dependent dehydrogenase (short-subunit alcohol dehydrogenase family)
MAGRLAGKTAFITAAAAGIGRAIALALAETGADIAFIRRLIGDGCPPTLALKIAL